MKGLYKAAFELEGNPKALQPPRPWQGPGGKGSQGRKSAGQGWVTKEGGPDPSAPFVLATWGQQRNVQLWDPGQPPAGQGVAISQGCPLVQLGTSGLCVLLAWCRPAELEGSRRNGTWGSLSSAAAGPCGPQPESPLISSLSPQTCAWGPHLPCGYQRPCRYPPADTQSCSWEPLCSRPSSLLAPLQRRQGREGSVLPQGRPRRLCWGPLLSPHVLCA